MRNPVPTNYRPPDLSDYEEPLDLIDEGLLDLIRALSYQADGLTLYSSVYFMNAANRFRVAGEELMQYRETLLRFVVPDLWELSDKVEFIKGVTPLRPDITSILGALEGIITAENYLWRKLSTWRKVERIRKILLKRNPEETSHGMCPKCFVKQMEEIGVVVTPEKLKKITQQKHAPGIRVVCGWCGKILQEPEHRYNPDVNLRQLEREYATSPSPDLMDKIIRVYERSGNFRFFIFSEGWQVQTTLPDGRVISSATQSHDGWWGIGHITWIGDSEEQGLGDHAVGDYPGPPPTREQVAKAHFEVVRKIEQEGIDSVVSYHRWGSFRDNPDITFRELEREYYNHPSPEALRKLNVARERAGIDIELPVHHLQMLFEDIINLMGKTLEHGMWNFPITGFVDDEYFRVNAWNLYDPKEEHINVHLNVERHRSGRKRAYQKASVDIYPDDVIYVAKSSRLASSRGSGDQESYTLPPNQPWVYHAKDLLDYVANEL